jgi:two-component system response regulator TctD
MKLLLIEDHSAMQTTLQRSLGRRGMQVQVCGDGARALDRWRASLPDVVLLDLSLPGEDGLTVLSRARAEGLDTPVLILTARGTVGDRILGLNTGADDYLPKPFDLDELEARILALARRQGQAKPLALGFPGSPGAGGSTFCGLRGDADSGAIYLHGQALELTAREAALMRALLARPGHAVSKDRLSELVFAGENDVQADAIEVVVYRLRKKLPASEVQLVTLRGLGYLLRPPAHEASAPRQEGPGNPSK